MTGEPLVPPLLHAVTVATLAALVLAVLWLVKRQRLSLRDSLLWLLSTLVALGFAIFPSALARAAHALGVAVPANALFAFAFVYVLGNLLALTVAQSGNTARIRRLAQESALLRAELEALRAQLAARDGAPDREP